ncbi:hypothetical protein EBU94_08860 [bacterium]|nr:hypothetical protein [bacterium]
MRGEYWQTNPNSFDGNSTTNYEVMSLQYATQGFTATVNNVPGYVTAITGVTLIHMVVGGTYGTLSGTGLYRKLGRITTH